jgi:3-phenylpropionate/trans-cinnamate dioxygenase ferredoxin reductase subunit
VEQEAPNVTTVVMDRPKKDYLPGQFIFMSLKFDSRWESWHAFSITSNPKEDHLSVSVKSLGDFSGKVAEMKQGGAVKIDSSYGSFSTRLLKDQRYIMIAGGVGITPIYGNLKDLKDQAEPPEVILLYSVHHESDILFRSDLDAWFSAKQNWHLHYICSSQPDWPGIKGRLTDQMVQSLCENDFRGTFLLCGPIGMVNALATYLRSQGVRRKKIKREQFVFLP